VLGRLEREQRELLAGAGEPGGEVRVQLESYQAALTEALLRGAPEPEIAELRRAFGVTLAAHEALLERMRGGAGPLLARARRHLEEALSLHADRSAIERVAASEVSSFLGYLLRTAEERAVVRVLEVLETVGGAERVRPLRRGLLAEDLDSRRDALRQLREACPEADALINQLRVLVEAPDVPSTFGDDLSASAALERLSRSADPYLRAGALWLAGVDASEAHWAEIRARAEADADTLVKQIALTARPGSGAALEAPYADRTTVEKMQSLRRISIFAELDPEDLEDLAALASEEIVSPPHALCEQGVVDAGDLMVLLEGSAVVTVRVRQSAGDVEREVAELGANEVVGELALVDGAPRSATVRPRGGPVRILRIPGRAFSSQLLPRERVARALLITLSQRLRRLGGRIAAVEK